MGALRLADRVAIVTGSSSGLGRAIAIALADNGASVVCSDVSAIGRQASEGEKTTHETITERGGKALFIEADVSDSESVQALVKGAVDAFGRLDIMVNNAGVSPEADSPVPIHETTEERFDYTMKVNARGPFLGCKYAAMQMLKQEALPGGKDRGWIVNMASVLAVMGIRGSPCYSASKGAVLSMTRGVAIDLASHRIHCNAILPGFMETPMISELSRDPKAKQALLDVQPFHRLGAASEIANTVVFLCSDDANGISGAAISVDGALGAQLKVR